MLRQSVTVPDRNQAVDIARGLAIALVVLGHANRGVLEQGTPNAGLLRALDWVVYAVHMPAFFYIAGYFTCGSLRRSSQLDYARSRLPNIVKPYLIWSVLFYLIGLAMGYLTEINRPIPASRLLEIAWRPINVLWFLYALLAMQLVAAAIRPNVAVGLVLALLSSALVSFLHLFDALGVLGKIAIHAPFFFIGMAVASRGHAVMGSFGRPGLLAGVGGVLWITAALLCYDAGVVEPVQFGTLPISLLGLVALLGLSEALGRRSAGADRVLAELGRASLAIYLLHIPVLATVPRALRTLDLDSDLPRLIGGLVIGVGGSYLAFAILSRLGVARSLGLR